MVASAISTSINFSISTRSRTPSISLLSHRNSARLIVSSLHTPYSGSSVNGLSSTTSGLPIRTKRRNSVMLIKGMLLVKVAQQVISQLVTLATIDEKADILMYLNCPGGSTYSVLAIYDCMSWIKPKVGTVCFGVAASQGALLLVGGEKECGMQCLMRVL